MNRLARLAVRVNEKIVLFGARAAEGVAVAVGVIMIYGVVMRYVFRQGVGWTYELPGWLFLCIIALSLAYAQAQRKHVRVELLVNWLPGKGRSILNMCAYAVFFILGIIYLRAAIIKLGRDWLTRSELTDLPVSPLLVVLCIGLVILCLQLLVDLGREIAELSGKSGEMDNKERPELPL